jgi:hypothetical protein
LKNGFKSFKTSLTSSNLPKSTIAHWSRFPVFVQQLFSSRFLADFDAQYSKLGVFGVEEFFFSKKL